MSAWPGTLPQFALQAGYQEDFQDQSIRTPTESGAMKVRRRFTARFDVISITLAMTAAQVETFETFYFTTKKGGSQTFTWVHPRKQTAVTLKFASKIGVTAIDADLFRVSFKIEVQP
jgi:hypothetical protein